MIKLSGVGVGMALTSPDEEGEMATNALVVLQVKGVDDAESNVTNGNDKKMMLRRR